jgi:hypothetical protein
MPVDLGSLAKGGTDQETMEIQRLARRERLTVGEWVRRTLREAREQKPLNDPEAN